MPRDKTESHKRIMEAARKEFLEFGYDDASLRRIAADAQLQVGALYKHFASKEELFDSLVEPAINGFYELFHKVEKEYFEGTETIKSDYQWVGRDETVRMMDFIYQHIDEFKLLAFKSKGTKYEDFIHKVAEMEEEVTLRYLGELTKKGCKVKEVDAMEFHLLMTSYAESFFQPLMHDLDREKAMHYAATLEEFYWPAWKAWLRI